MEEERLALEKLLREKVQAVPDPVFRDLLRFYADFGLTPNRMEIGALLDASGGNALAVRALNGYLKKSGAGYKVASTPYEQFSADLDSVEKLSRLFWTGSEFSKEAGEIFDGTPMPSFDAEGREIQCGYKWTGTDRAIQNAAFSQTVTALEKAAEAWSAEVLPRIVEDPDGKPMQIPHELPPVEEEPDSGEGIEKELGAERAAVDAKAKETLRFYASQR